MILSGNCIAALLPFVSHWPCLIWLRYANGVTTASVACKVFKLVALELWSSSTPPSWLAAMLTPEACVHLVSGLSLRADKESLTQKLAQAKHEHLVSRRDFRQQATADNAKIRLLERQLTESQTREQEASNGTVAANAAIIASLQQQFVQSQAQADNDAATYKSALAGLQQQLNNTVQVQRASTEAANAREALQQQLLQRELHAQQAASHLAAAHAAELAKLNSRLQQAESDTANAESCQAALEQLYNNSKLEAQRAAHAATAAASNTELSQAHAAQSLDAAAGTFRAQLPGPAVVRSDLPQDTGVAVPTELRQQQVNVKASHQPASPPVMASMVASHVYSSEDDIDDAADTAIVPGGKAGPVASAQDGFAAFGKTSVVKEATPQEVHLPASTQLQSASADSHAAASTGTAHLLTKAQEEGAEHETRSSDAQGENLHAGVSSEAYTQVQAGQDGQTTPSAGATGEHGKLEVHASLCQCMLLCRLQISPLLHEYIVCACVIIMKTPCTYVLYTYVYTQKHLSPFTANLRSHRKCADLPIQCLCV